MKVLQEYETDWINSRPVYYHARTKKVGLNMIDVIDWDNFEFDPEGLYNYLFFGYQVFEQTAVKHVRFIPHSTIITQYLDDDAKLQLIIKSLNDPIESYIGKKSTVEIAVNTLHGHVQKFEKLSQDNQKGKRFLLPLSGGYDSRLLATLIEDKSRIDAFTYDISLSEAYSFEVQFAHEVCQRLNINWKKLLLNKYWNNNYIQRNFSAFCLEMPIHAAFHMEMYDKIIQDFGNQYIVLSGSVGDWWSGLKMPLNTPKNFHNFDSLFFNHGISIPSEFINVPTNHEIKANVYEKNIQRLKEDEVFKIVFARRGRIGLASYIYRTAELYFDTYTPFYDIEIAMTQLNLPSSQRTSRIWLDHFFSERNLDVGQEKLNKTAVSKDYSLDIKTAYYSLEEKDLLQTKYFKNIVDYRRIEWINNCLVRTKKIPFPLLVSVSQMFYRADSLTQILYPGSFWGKGFDFVYNKTYRTADIFKAISEWTVLKPLELAMVKARERLRNK